MKNILKKSLTLASAALLLASCSDWTKVESVGIDETMPWENNPKEWADYQVRVRNYKNRPHKLAYIRFANSPEGVQNEKGNLRSLPDSLDIVSLTNGANFSEYDAEDMARMRAVDIKVIYQVDLAAAEDAATAIDKAVNTVKENALDGYSFTAASKASASEAVDRLSEVKSENQILVFEGDPVFISSDDIAKIDLFVLATETVENPYDLRNVIEDAVERGVPRERILLAASRDGVFHNSENVEVPVLEAMADNVVNYGPMAGLALYDIESDYYHYDRNWSSLRSIISRLNH